MAAQRAVVLENHTKLFVEAKVGERIKMEFTTGQVQIKPESKHGSTTLGAFWVRVVQAYFPREEFTYSKRYCSKYGSESISTTADGYLISVYLRTGLVIVTGSVVYEWFNMIFRKMMQHYDKITHCATRSDYFNDQVALDIRRELHLSKADSARHRRHHAESEDCRQNKRNDLISSNVDLPDRDIEFLDNKNLEFRDPATSKDEGQVVLYEPKHAEVGGLSLREGNHHVYPLWKQLLNRWLSDEHCKVYICSRHIDAERYVDVATLAYRHKLYQSLQAVYTNVTTHNGQRMAAVREQLLKNRSPDEQLFIEYRVLNKIQFPASKSLSCNFIAGVSEGVAEIMVTSATFDQDGFGRSNNLQTVNVVKMSEHEFKSKFIDTISESLH